MIEVKNISKLYKAGKGEVHALQDVSMEIGDGEIVGIVGASGAGKSTFIRCINLLERPDSGQVIIAGKDLTRLSEREIEQEREKIGMIFQQFNLFSQRTVFQNVAYPLDHKGLSRKQIRERVEELLQLVGIPDKCQTYPAQLSGGQKQRVAIARALAAEPQILLCDEATSALDPETTKAILKLLKEINKKLGISLIVVTHQKEVVKEICSRVIVLEHGRVVENASALQLFTAPESPAAKSFIGEINEHGHVRQILSAFQENENERLVKLIFIGREAGDAYISRISREFGIQAGILFGNIDIIQEETVGILIVKLKGPAAQVEQAVEYLKENQITVEEVG